MISQSPALPRTSGRGNSSQPIWLVTPITVITASTTNRAETWIGMVSTSAGMTIAPVIASSGWKLIAAQAVGGRLAWWTAWARRNSDGRCIQRWVQ